MRILLIEDDQDISNSLKVSFEAESFTVDIAVDGYSGSYIARTNEYDLIILDLALPKKNGWDVCNEIRTAHKTTPIIMLSVVSDTQEKIRLLNCGADDYLTKPFSFRELLARTRALLRRPAHMAHEIVQVDDLILDSMKQKVIRGKETIYLTRKEFSLLEYLMRHKGLVVSRGMIMEHVWNAESDPFSNTIEAHILNVRKKVDRIKRRRLIHTIPGRGYKIDVEHA
ncbi:MAG: response regulator transcription factor [bacterium]|nr:response regulator transcription factor [bacterium]